MISIHRGICGRSGEFFMRNNSGAPDTKNLQRGKNRVILTCIIEARKHGKGKWYAVPVADRQVFQPHPQPHHGHGGAGSAAACMAGVGVFCPHHRYGAGVGHRGAQWAEPAHRFVSGAQGRKQRLPESKAPEKKEDPWKAIRGMGRANEIIADLEAGGVMSFSELSGFFFNTPHDDDHTTELADLRKKFTAIDTLIEKMKHRDELEPVYKEYQGKSGWSQSRFKKKNAATIEDYEQTVKYIKEHIKKYAVDGKPPTMLDLLEKSNKLKSKWNRLNVEHTAFLTKRETAKKYTRQVRQYINEQQMKREREKYRQKKLT